MTLPVAAGQELVPMQSEGEVKRVIMRFARSERLKDPWLSTFEECFEYAMPSKESVFDQTAGQRRTDKIFDETAVVAVPEFASRIQAGICPPYSRWCELESGPEVPADERPEVDLALEGVTEYLFDVINSSNFNQEAAEGFHDLSVGTACLHVDDGDDVLHPLRFTTIPLSQLWIDYGPDDSVDFIARKRKLRISQVRERYPRAMLTAELAQCLEKGEDKEIELLEVVQRDWKAKDETWDFHLIEKARGEGLMKTRYVGIGSCPFIIYRWSKIAGEAWGRGPLLNAMPAVRTANLVIELILENAEMAISGIYTIEDDGTINVDNIQLLPGTVIPVAQGSQGMKALPQAGNFDVAQLVLNEMRSNIKRALFNDSLGNPEKTPMSATEVSERMADLSRRIGASFGRLQTEFIEPVIRRCIYLLKRQGRIKLPTVNGRVVRIRATSPLSQAQKHQDVATVGQYVTSIGQMFGPQMTNLLVKSEEAAQYMADKLGVPLKLLRSDSERKQLAGMVQDAMAQMSPNPEAPPSNGTGTGPAGP